MSALDPMRMPAMRLALLSFAVRDERKRKRMSRQAFPSVPWVKEKGGEIMNASRGHTAIGAFSSGCSPRSRIYD
jgi:hypothetical protein